jgi:hypothetical protein
LAMSASEASLTFLAAAAARTAFGSGAEGPGFGFAAPALAAAGRQPALRRTPKRLCSRSQAGRSRDDGTLLKFVKLV